MLLTGFARVVTNAGQPGEPMEIIDGAVAIDGETIAWVGPATDIPDQYHDTPVTRYGGKTLIPGFVDSHTHAVFAGDRADEFAARLAGAGYAEVLAGGGGIHATVRATAAMSW